MKFNDAVWGVLFVLFAGAILIHVQPFPKIPGQNVGPGLFPGSIAVGIAICGLVLIGRGLRMRRAGGEAGRWLWLPPWLKSGPHVLAFAVLVGINVFYLLAVDKLGFIITGFVYLLAFMSVLKVRLSRAIPIAFIMTLVIHYAFYKMLKVPLPWGVLTPYAW
ncbi:MAG: tripartite tricarboxylate transporter TctB family protein [Betaproteobacteria bacterium]